MAEAAMCLQACLLQPAPELQAAAAQLLGALARHAPPGVCVQLVEADACEYLFELIRATLATPGSGSGLQLGGASQGGGAPSGAAPAAADEAEALQCRAVAALHNLSHAGGAFVRHLHFGLDTLVSLVQRAAATRHGALLADSLGLLATLAAPPDSSAPGGLAAAAALAAAQLPRATAKRLAAALESILPEPPPIPQGAAGGGAQMHPLQGAGELRLPVEMQAAYIRCCRWGPWDSKCCRDTLVSQKCTALASLAEMAPVPGRCSPCASAAVPLRAVTTPARPHRPHPNPTPNVRVNGRTAAGLLDGLPAHGGQAAPQTGRQCRRPCWHAPHARLPCSACLSQRAWQRARWLRRPAAWRRQRAAR